MFLITDSSDMQDEKISIGEEEHFLSNYNFIMHGNNIQQHQNNMNLGSHQISSILNKNMKRNRRRRTAFTHSQLAFLERKFR